MYDSDVERHRWSLNGQVLHLEMELERAMMQSFAIMQMRHGVR